MRRLSALTLCLVLTIPCTSMLGALAHSPWPMFRHDLRHTGVSECHDPAAAGTPWRFYIGGSLLSSCAIGSDGTMYLGGGTYLYAVNPNGTLKWRTSIGSSTRSSPAIGDDGAIYIGSGDNGLYAVNSDGTQRWTYATGGGLTSSPAIGADGTIYIGSKDGNLYAINAGGTLRWTVPVGTADMTSPAIGPDGTIYIGGGNRCLNAVNPDGTIKWTYLTGGSILSSPSVSPDGTRIYVGSYDQYLHCVDSEGARVWRFPVALLTSNTPSSPAVGVEGTVYVGSHYGTLHAINPDGTERWRHETLSDIRSSPAVSADGTIYFGAWNGFVYALNPDGTRKWCYGTRSSFFSSPAIDATGSVVIPAWDGYLYGNLNHNLPLTSPPSGLQATALSESSIRLDWTDTSSDEFGFRVEKKRPDGDFESVCSVPANTVTCTVTGLPSGTAYVFRVAAYQEGGFAYSNETTATTLGVAAPSGLAASMLSGSRIDLSWTDNSPNETGFVIERKAGNIGSFRQIAAVGPETTSYSDESVNPDTDYYYRVASYSLDAYSTYTNEEWAASEARDYTDIKSASTGRHQMALTFDGGTTDVRPGILRILRDYGIRCTFFVTGQVAQAVPGYWQTAANDGHQICNHSWNHPNFTGLTDDQIRAQLLDCDAMVNSILGWHTRPFFRAPGGARDARVLSVAAEIGFRHVYWTVDSGDYNNDSSYVTQRVLNGAKDGAVVLFHCTRESTETALHTIIPELLARGYELVTVSELIAPDVVTSPAVPAGWSLFSVPIEPAYPTPPVVLKDTQIDGSIYSWKNEVQGMSVYDSLSGTAFGPVNPDYGYWLVTPAPVTLRVSGRLQTTHRTIMLPHTAPNPCSAWTIIGYPFLNSQEWGNCSVFNPNAPEPKTRSVAEARNAGWLCSVLYGWDNGTQGLFDMGLEDDWVTNTTIEPWHGYWMETYADDLRLIIPPP